MYILLGKFIMTTVQLPFSIRKYFFALQVVISYREFLMKNLMNVVLFTVFLCLIINVRKIAY
jgi:hypothetical protein